MSTLYKGREKVIDSCGTFKWKREKKVREETHFFLLANKKVQAHFYLCKPAWYWKKIT